MSQEKTNGSAPEGLAKQLAPGTGRLGACSQTPGTSPMGAGSSGSGGHCGDGGSAAPVPILPSPACMDPPALPCLPAPSVPGARGGQEQTGKDPCNPPCHGHRGSKSPLGSRDPYFHSALTGCRRKTEHDLNPRLTARWPGGDGTPKAGWHLPAGMAGAPPAPRACPPRTNQAMPTAGGWDVSLSPWLSWSATTCGEHPARDHQPKRFWHKLDPGQRQDGGGLRPPGRLRETWGPSRDTSPTLQCPPPPPKANGWGLTVLQPSSPHRDTAGTPPPGREICSSPGCPAPPGPHRHRE